MAFMNIIPLSVALELSIITLVAYTLSLTIYRLYFSPLAKFPGPKLAAATWWYEFYYDVVLRGQYIFHIKELHERYGPIIRISPYEIHIYTPSFYDEVYAVSNRKRDRWAWSTRPGGFGLSIGGTNAHDLHRMRRGALAPYFSKANIRRLQYAIDEKVMQLVGRLVESKTHGEPFKLNHAFAAFTNDIAMEYSFGRNDNRLAHKEYDPTFHDNFVAGVGQINLLRHMFWLEKVAKLVPEWLLAKVSSVVAMFWAEKQAITEQIQQILNGANKDHLDKEHPTIYHEILGSKLPDQEKSLDRLAQEAQITIGAGTLATAWTLSVGCFHLLTPECTPILMKLRAELLTILPDPDGKIDLVILERMPYLTACVKEALRMGNGTSTRLQRIAPEETLIFPDPQTGKEWAIPAGTPVSLSSLLIHRDESIFQEARKFRPERWLENPGLDRYLLTFSKGSRQCLGMHLAYAEMYLTMARVFRAFGTKELEAAGVKSDFGNIELFETTERDVICVADLMVPAVWEGSQGVRIKVTA
ncbi:trichodiene oxygenase [Coleophoma crateriformis]|uniref:Trichodiene oxygenase n=1 Tax=Coleophoma crateriformis TaxID=565419 RepID=A0A3D8TAN6_9HELO|nr:trichodiene oxygenase [Coleophoma crateriformis]